MAYTNSKLVTYQRLTSDRTAPRKYKIDTITIHCYVGQVTAKQGCDYFATTSRQVSSNYVVGYDGSIGLSVEEKNRAWTSGGKDANGNIIRVNGISGSDNDHRAVTIEVACDPNPPYAVTDKAMKALIELVADICKRNDIKKLLWKADKSLVGQVDKQNMTVHRWFAQTACPGDYLYKKHSYIADQVNKKLGATEVAKPAPESKPAATTKPATTTSTPAFKVGDEVKLVEGAKYTNGKAIPKWLVGKKVYVREIRKNGDIVFSTLKIGLITGVVDDKYLVKYATTPKFKAYKVKVTADVLNVRAGAGTNYKVVTTVKKNQVYTIVDEKNGFGKLKSGAGWISLNYTKKV